jgi:hypothetical protein
MIDMPTDKHGETDREKLGYTPHRIDDDCIDQSAELARVILWCGIITLTIATLFVVLLFIFGWWLG